MTIHRRIATYTDGTEVSEGDRIRYRQAPGGLMAPSAEWVEGVAVKMQEFVDDPDRRQRALENGIDVDELVLDAGDGGRYSIVSHIVERA